MNRFAKQLERFVEVTEQGQRLKDFKVLIGTWHTLRELGESQLAVMGILENMQLRGLVQVRTRSLDQEAKSVIQRLDLERRMRATGHSAGQLEVHNLNKHGQHLDWEWEGGTIV